MLSDSERKVLAEIELSLTVNDPGFAERLGTKKAGRAGNHGRLVYAVVAVFSLLLGIGCVALGAVGPGLLAVCFAGVVMLARRMRYQELSDRPASRPDSHTNRP
ncbi:DUF3040 domain-containing protein [Pseudonocardia sp.]|jgi:hypothetical protein|uniref:DUF3040 domain-containing protein n=1 Tax=Pseudonocardia sp. TaxID=60912 RepID=UPI002F425C14